MAFDTALLDLMPHTLTVKAQASLNDYGEPAYAATGRSVTALVVYKNKVVRTADGREHTSSAQAFVADTTIVETDQVTLPDGTTRPVMAVTTYADADGAYAQEVAFQ